MTHFHSTRPSVPSNPSILDHIDHSRLVKSQRGSNKNKQKEAPSVHSILSPHRRAGTSRSFVQPSVRPSSARRTLVVRSFLFIVGSTHRLNSFVRCYHRFEEEKMMMMSSTASSAAHAAPVKRTIRRRTTKQSSSPIVAGSSRRCASVVANASTTSNPRFALLFDCDGVIVETEELHRLAYNGAFEAFELKIDGTPVEWVVEYYDVLQNTVGGGKPKMKWHFGQNAWPTSTMFAEAPTSDEDRDALVDALQDKKTEIYKKIVEEIAVARPGVLRLMDEAIADPSIAVGICSAATKAGFEKVVNSVVGADRLSRMDVVMAGDDVVRKKPDPLIYNLARERIGISADKCVVVEDSLVGLRAAVGASMHCVITPTSSTASADFLGEGAKKVVADLGEDAVAGVTIAKLFPIDAAEPNFNF